MSKNSARITKELVLQSKQYDWSDVIFSMEVKNIGKWEKANNVGVNVFGYEEDKKKLYTIKTCDEDLFTNKIANLYLHNDLHYCAITNPSRFASMQPSKYKCGKHICYRCWNAFGTEKLLVEHKELCDEHKIYGTIFPTEKTKWLYFRNCMKMHRVPIVGYADFECLITPIAHTEPSPEKSFTVQYQRHVPSGFCLTFVCVDESVYKTKTIQHRMRHPDEDVGKEFVKRLDIEKEAIYEVLKRDVGMKITDEERQHKNAKECYACEEPFTLDNPKTHDHCHVTGEYRRAACNKCNLVMRTPGFVPILFHNLEGYDAHLFIKSLGYNTDENIRLLQRHMRNTFHSAKTFLWAMNIFMIMEI